MGFTTEPFSKELTPTGLKPGGPLFAWILRSVPEPTRTRFKEVGVDLKGGEVYTWSTGGGKTAFYSGPTKAIVFGVKPASNTLALFPYNSVTLRDAKYLCDFDRTLNDGDLMKLFLKETTQPAKPAGPNRK